MKYALPALILIGGCAVDQRPADDNPDFERRRPTTSDYQRVALEVLDAIGALSDRHLCLQGITLPPNAAANGVDYTLRHDHTELRLLVRVTLDTPAPEGLSIVIGRLRIAIRAERSAADAVLDEIREQIDQHVYWFNSRFNSEEQP